jgi:hypothetical protein
MILVWVCAWRWFSFHVISSLSFVLGPPADHRILVFQVVASVYSVSAEIGPLFDCAANEQALDYQ